MTEKADADALTFAEYALTAGELGSCAGQTVIVALLPLLLREYAPSNFWIGFAVGGEGVFALLLPFLVGAATDRMSTNMARRVGRHAFFLLISLPVMLAALLLLPFVSGYWLLTGVTFAFFAAMHVYVTPLMTLVIDTVPDHKRARVQGVNSLYHSLGLAYGLVAAGLLYSLWKPLPFIVAAVLLLVSTAVTTWAELRLDRDRAPERGRPSQQPRLSETRLLAELRGNPAATWLLAANALWNGAVDGIRPYILVFAMVVTHISVATTSLGLVVLVVAIAIGSAVFGKLGDRYDRAQLLEYGVLLVLFSMIAGYWVRGPSSALVVLIVAGAGAAAMTTLPYPLFANLMGERGTGKYSGLFVVSVSFGRLCAPMFVGAAVDVGARFAPEYKGYPFMWPAAALLAALGWYALRRARAAASARTRSGHEASSIVAAP